MMDGSHGSDDEESSGEQGEERGRSARENHCEIERRRRNKMTQYITELSELIPECTTTQHKKLDKLTILRLAVTHMKKLQNNSVGGRPSFLTDQELKFLLLEAADGFLFVVHLSTGRFLYVSDTVTPVLGILPAEWYNGGMGTIYDQVHPDDVRKVQEQMSVTEGHRVLDLKTGTIKKESHQTQMRMGLGWRRSFVCRFRVGLHQLSTGTGGSATNSHVARSRSRAAVDGPDGSQYAVVHVSGQLKNYPAHGNNGGEDMYGGGSAGDAGNSAGNSHCLVAVARLQVTSLPDSMTNGDGGRFTTRHSAALADESVLTFADQQMTNLLGWMPQELLGKNFLRDYIAPESQAEFSAAWEAVFHEKSQHLVYSVNVLTKSGNRVPLNVNIEAFLNPYSEEMEFIICTHTNPMEHSRSANAGLGNANLAGNAQQPQSIYHLDGGTPSSVHGGSAAAALLQLARPSVIAPTQQTVYQPAVASQQQTTPGYYPSTIGLSFQQPHQPNGWAGNGQNDHYISVPQLPNAANWFFGGGNGTTGPSTADYSQHHGQTDEAVAWPSAVGVVGGETGGAPYGSANRANAGNFATGDYTTPTSRNPDLQY